MFVLGRGGRRENSPSFGWLNNQVNMRQIDKRKIKFNFYVWEPHIYERVRDTAYMNGSETERENEICILI